MQCKTSSYFFLAAGVLALPPAAGLAAFPPLPCEEIRQEASGSSGEGLWETWGVIGSKSGIALDRSTLSYTFETITCLDDLSRASD